MEISKLESYIKAFIDSQGYTNIPSLGHECCMNSMYRYRFVFKLKIVCAQALPIRVHVNPSSFAALIAVSIYMAYCSASYKVSYMLFFHFGEEFVMKKVLGKCSSMTASLEEE